MTVGPDLTHNDDDGEHDAFVAKIGAEEKPTPVGGATEPLGLLALSWLWLLLAALVATGAIAALAFRRRTA